MVVESKITISLISQLFGRDLIDGLSRSAGMQDLYRHVKEFIGCAKHANIVTFNRAVLSNTSSAEVSVDRYKAIWNARFEKVMRDESALVGEPWLEHWLELVPRRESQRALDVGCGSGYNARLLLEYGFEVTAIDFSERALELCRREAPRAHVQLADIREGMPFAGSHFELIVADLSLHYFPWELTRTIVANIAERLVPGGLFASRFNSTNDENYGTGEPINGESNLFVVEGIKKRFFTQECLKSLFGPQWKMVSLTEKTSLRFGSPKVLWELATIKI